MCAGVFLYFLLGREYFGPFPPRLKGSNLIVEFDRSVSGSVKYALFQRHEHLQVSWPNSAEQTAMARFSIEEPSKAVIELEFRCRVLLMGDQAVFFPIRRGPSNPAIKIDLEPAEFSGLAHEYQKYYVAAWVECSGASSGAKWERISLQDVTQQVEKYFQRRSN